MKVASEVSSDKLRGGFYSPDPLVALCWSKVDALVRDRVAVRILEPTAGDGAFLRGLAQHPIRERVASVDAVELLPAEAEKARNALQVADVPGAVHTGSFLDPMVADRGHFDISVGNPPYLRYQFINEADQAGIALVEGQLGRRIGKVSNLWIPIFLSAVLRLEEGGAFSFILPSEFLTGVSAGVVREWLTERTDVLEVEMFPAKSFPGVLQEVIIVSGRVNSAHPARVLHVLDHEAKTSHEHALDNSEPTWTAFTLDPTATSAMRLARVADNVMPLGTVARLGVSTVTGANSFFTYDEPTRQEYELGAWSRPLLSRTRHVPGLEAGLAEWQSSHQSGVPTWLLDVGVPAPDRREHVGLDRYLTSGDAAGLATRYKTRIREPWYKVPVVASKPLLLSKRSHMFPRLIANTADLLTTDTIYQGTMLPGFEGADRGLVAGFHNSLTLLSAEIEGRSFGGGVLELVPSEVARLAVFDPRVVGDRLADLDAVARAEGYESEALVAATNSLLSQTIPGLDPELLSTAEAARQYLLERRLARN